MRTGANNFGTLYSWRLYGPKAAEAVRAIYPWLVGKKRQADLIMEFAATIGAQGRKTEPAVKARREEIYLLLRTLNARRTRNAERLSEKAPAERSDDAIVRSHGNRGNRETEAEMTSALKIVS